MALTVFYGWWVVLASFFISLYVGSVVFYGFTAFIEPLVHAFGWTYTQVSFAASLRGLEMSMLAPLVGFLVDRFGSRRIIVSGIVTVGVGLLLLSLTQSLVTFYGAFILLAFGGGGCTSVVTMSVVGAWFRRRVGVAYGLLASGFGASGLMVPCIVWLIDSVGWRMTFVILGAGMWVLVLPISMVIRNRPEDYGYLPDGESRDVSAGEQVGEAVDVEIDLRGAIRDRAFVFLTVSEALRLMVTGAVVVHVMPYLSSLGIARTTGALVAAGIPLCSIIGRFGFGWLWDVCDKRFVMTAASGCMLGGLIAFYYVYLPWAKYAFLLLYPTGVGGMMVLRGSFIREHFGRRSLGKLLGIVFGSGSLGGIIGPTLAGWIFDRTGAYDVVWLAFSGCLVVATFLVWRMRT
jgi:MFS family permease